MLLPVIHPFSELNFTPSSRARLPSFPDYYVNAESPATDVQALTEGDDILSSLTPAFERYNESQLATVKLPGSSQEVGSAIGCPLFGARGR